MNNPPSDHIGCDEGGIFLNGIYDIYQGSNKIGKVEVRQEGLYYRFLCCCDLTGEVMYRICVTCGGKSENLGIPVPEGDCFRLSAKLPVSRFAKDTPEFRAIPRHPENPSGLWTPISPEVPFDYIQRLQNAVLERRGGQLGILISDKVPPGNDPNP